MVSIIDVSNGKSFFSLLPTIWFSKKPNNRAIHRLCTLMRKMNAKTMICEELASNYNTIIQEKEALDRYFNWDTEVKIFRITLSQQAIPDQETLLEDLHSDFLSSSVIINYKNKDNEWESYVYYSIICVPRMEIDEGKRVYLLNNYLHLSKKFECEIQVTEQEKINFKIHGSFFCQQNSRTSVCSHASLCMTLNNSTVLGDNLIYPEDVNKELGIQHPKGNPGEWGLNIIEIADFLSRKGLETNHMDYFQYPTTDYAEYLYRYMESGLPTLLIFNTRPNSVAHIVPILGHTLNTDMWRPEAEFNYSGLYDGIIYRSTAAWVDHFIIHDDNFGMYSCLPVDSLKRTTLPRYDPSFRALRTIAIVPQGVKSSPWLAELASVELAKKYLISSVSSVNFNSPTQEMWIKKLHESAKKENIVPLVVRTSLVYRSAYERHLKYVDFENHAFSDPEQARMTSGLPDVFWLTEITLPDLYIGNKTKLIDVISTGNVSVADLPNAMNQCIQLRLPGALIKRKVGRSDDISELGIHSHYTLFSRHSDNKVIEW